MGQDKALMPFLGKPLIQRVITRVASLGDEVVITTNNAQNYLNFKIPLFADLIPGIGALGGLLTALSVCRFPYVFVVACDMPFINPAILAVSFEKLLANDADAVIPQTRNGYEPFHAVYRRESCVPAIERAIQSGEKRLISWFPEIKLIPIQEPELLVHDPQQIAFMNLNTKEDFLKAELLAKEHE